MCVLFCYLLLCSVVDYSVFLFNAYLSAVIPGVGEIQDEEIVVHLKKI